MNTGSAKMKAINTSLLIESFVLFDELKKKGLSFLNL
jgi:hypothetical protein